MKKIKYIFLLFITIFLITGCSSTHITEIDYNKLINLMNNEESFAIEIFQTGCPHCESFAPKLNRFLNKYNINMYSLNKAKLSDKEKEEFSSLFGSIGTPTIVFIENGVEKGILYRLVGDVDTELIISKFTINGYIEK